MTDEQIEKAAQEYVRNNHTVNPYNIIATRESFKDGIVYALSHQWISVEERLPEAYTDVLIATDKGQIRVSHLKVARSVIWTWPGSFVPKVIAWMPIPAIPQLNPEEQSI